MNHIPPDLKRATAALSLALFSAGAHATTLTSQALTGGHTLNADGSIASVFDLVCDSPACVASSFVGASVSLSGSYLDADISFSSSASAQTPDTTLLRARAALDLTGASFGGSKDRLWFARAVSGMQTEMVLAPPTPADTGAAVDLVLRYRFEGSVVNNPGGDVVTAAEARVRSASSPFAQFLACNPDPADARYCLTQPLGVRYDEAFPFETWLDVGVSALALPNSASAHAAQLEADYSRTLQLVGAQVFDNKGAELAGWSLALATEGTVLVTSTVPEPAPLALWLAGLAGLATVLRTRHQSPASS